MRTTRDLKKYIVECYPKVHHNRIMVVKIGWNIFIVLVTRDNVLAKEKLIGHNLEAVDGVYHLKKQLDDKIHEIMVKHGYN